MTAHQQQLRRGTAAQCDGKTPAAGELVIDTTNNRGRLGDGSTAGGIIIPNAADIQKLAPNFAVAGGSANTLTVTLSPVPTYAQPLTVFFKASATNTGAATLNVNTLGAKDLQKISGGSLTALSAGDILSGGIYMAIYDGTQFQVYGLQSTGLVSVSQGDLNTSTGTFSSSTGLMISVASGICIPQADMATIVTLPGGEYGFQILSAQNDVSTVNTSGWVSGRRNSTTNAACIWPFVIATTTTAVTVKGQQRYVTSSPPFDMGDGEAGGFIFAVVDSDGNIVSHYSADVPPWAYNGPTDIRCTHKCPITGKKYRRAIKKLSAEQIMDGGKIEYEMQEITQEMKNADMALIPHPFGEIPTGHRVILIDPMSDKVRRLIEIQNAGESDVISEILSKGHLKIDNQKISRKGPAGVHICAAKFANKRGA